MTNKRPYHRKAKGAPESAGYMLRREVTVDDRTVDTLRRLGAGNLSAGVRKAAGIVELLDTMKKEVDK